MAGLRRSRRSGWGRGCRRTCNASSSPRRRGSNDWAPACAGVTRMAYQLDFADISNYSDVLAKGVGLTVTLIGVGGTLGVAVGIFGAWARGYGRRPWLSKMVGAYVELIRNTPFLIQLFFIFFG